MSSRWKILILILIFIPLATLGLVAGYFMHRIWEVSKIITIRNEISVQNSSAQLPQNQDSSDSVQKINAPEGEKKDFHLLDFAQKEKIPSRGTNKRINILLLGKANQDYPGSDLTDTIILASVNPETNQTSLLSIPRDLYVRVPDTNTFTKINAVYVNGMKKGGHQKGIEEIEKVVNEITGQGIDYYVMVNFTAFEKFIDLLSGVDVNVEQDIYDDRYPGPNFSYQTFEIKKGQQHLDGATALKYVRVRHNNAGGDFGRAKRQQQILEAMKDKFFQKRGIIEGLDFFNNALEIVKDNVKTDVPFSDYMPFLLLAKDVNIHQVVNKVLDNGSGGVLENYNPVMGGVTAYCLRPKAGNYFQIHQIASNIFNLDLIERQEKARTQENAKILVLAPLSLSSYASKVRTFLSNQDYQSLSGDVELSSVSLWQRKPGAKLPVISDQNRDNLTSDSLIDKLEISPDNLRQTVIYDNAEGSKPFSLEDLTRRLDAQVSLFKDNRTDADFVIILGGNVAKLFDDDSGEFFLTDEGKDQEKAENSDQ